jgi:hypothetical protein
MVTLVALFSLVVLTTMVAFVAVATKYCLVLPALDFHNLT